MILQDFVVLNTQDLSMHCFDRAGIALSLHECMDAELISEALCLISKICPLGCFIANNVLPRCP